jgi:hypothetical protein
VQADQLEVPRRERANGSLRLEVSLLHEPGPKRGAGKRGGDDGYDGKLHRTDPLREKQRASSPARKTAARR